MCLNKTNNLSLVLLFYFPSVPLCIYSYSICCTKLICRELRAKSSPTLVTQTDRIKKQRHHFANKGPYSQSYVFFSRSHVWMWKVGHKEGWAPKNWCFQTVVLEKTLESPLDNKEIKPVNPKGNQPWIFIGRTDAEAPILWPPDVKTDPTGKDPDAGKDWRQEEKGVAEDEVVGGHHWLSGHEFEQIPGDSEGQGSLGCCRPWGHKESDMTLWLNNSNVAEKEEGSLHYFPGLALTCDPLCPFQVSAYTIMWTRGYMRSRFLEHRLTEETILGQFVGWWAISHRKILRNSSFNVALKILTKLKIIDCLYECTTQFLT